MKTKQPDISISDLPDYIEILKNILHHPDAPDDAMLVTELDGYLAGILICSETLMPSEWLPVVWGRSGYTPFENEEHAEEIIGAVMEMYNDINKRMISGTWAPLYDLDFDGSPMWEIWLEGFWKAVKLRMNLWQAILQDESHHDRRVSAYLLTRLHQLSSEYEGNIVMRKEDKVLYEDAADVIPLSIDEIFKERNTPVMAHVSQKTGRNDPCSCGSGKKFGYTDLMVDGAPLPHQPDTIIRWLIDRLRS